MGIHNIHAQDLFNHDLGSIYTDNNYDESRFGNYCAEYSKITNAPALDLGPCNFSLTEGFHANLSENAGSGGRSRKGNDWFENTGGELMGAFLHLQVQDPKNPFGINLELPSLMDAQDKNSIFPFPCVSIESAQKKQRETRQVDRPWDKISEELRKNKGIFCYEPEKRKKFGMWELNENKKTRIQGIITDIGQEYEIELRKTLDSSYKPTQKALSMPEFLQNVKNLLLGVPNKLHDLESGKNRSRFRLESHAHQLTSNFLRDIIITAQSYRHLSSLVISMQAKNELIAPAFARGLKQILGFFENLILSIPESLTLIQFSIQTESIRTQVNCLNTICQEIPSGLRLLDYLYEIITKNEGDFENYHLLQMLFKKSIRPILDLLTDFVFNCEINDIFGEFFIQQHKGIDSSIDYSTEKYETAYLSLPCSLISPISACLITLGRNMRILKFLEESLGSYYQLLSTATLTLMETSETPVPSFKISYNNTKIEALSDRFIAFQAAQTERLLELEQHELQIEQKHTQLMNDRKKQSLQEIKLVATAKTRVEREKILEDREKKSAFYMNLEAQLRDNKELKRIEEAKRAEEEARISEKMEREQREMVEKGKQYLMDRHQEMLSELYAKRDLEAWKTQRRKLNSKRESFFKKDEELLRERLQSMMDIEEQPVDYRENGGDEVGEIGEVGEVGGMDWKSQEIIEVQDTDMEIEGTIKKVEYPTRVRQPPGGVSSMRELFQYNFHQQEPEKINAFQPRIGYREDLETLSICSSLLWEEILNRVFRKITPKKQWEIPAKIDDFDIFNDLFPNFSEKKKESKNLLLPFPKIIEKLIFEPIRVQAEIVNKSCVHLFLRKLKLINHLKALKRYALLEAGDTIDLFLNTIFSSGFTGNMTAAWEGSIKMSSSREDEYAEHFHIHIKNNSLYRMQFKTVDDLEFLVIKYNIKGPLQIVLSPERIEQYSRAFTNLLRVKHVTSILSNIKMFRVPNSHPYHRKIHLLRQKMQHFLDIYQGYIASELHGTSWKFLTKNITKAKSLDEVVAIHKRYLDMIMTRCFLTDKGTVVLNQLDAIFKLVMKFKNMLLDVDSYSLEEFDRFEQDFNSIHRFAFKMTGAMASKGNYPELFVRLDFNDYMTKKIERENITN